MSDSKARTDEQISDTYLRLILALLLEARTPNNYSKQVEFLSSRGLGSVDIGRILGKDASQVSKDVYKIRRRR